MERMVNARTTTPRPFLSWIVALAVLVLPISLPRAHADGVAKQIVADANTVLLDHMNSVTAGTVYGPLTFEPSLPNLGQAGRFGPGAFVQYAFPGWYPGCCATNPATQGTVEMWLKAEHWGDLLNFNWFSSPSAPPSGHVLYAVGAFDFTNRAFFYQTWNFERCCYQSALTGTTVLPVGEWIHLALSWGPTVSKLYLNGQVEASVPTNVYPALGSTVYAYLHAWGAGDFVGLIDEFHVSKVQRSDAEILEHATLTPTIIQVVIDIKPGSFPNSINPGNKGVIPVAVLTTDAFDAATINPATVRFGPAGTEAAVSQSALEDVNGDGRSDLILHFRTQASGIACGTTSAVLTGETFTQQAIRGADSVVTVGCR